jgi:HK97 family phage portal protein
VNLFGQLLFRAAGMLTPVSGNRGGWRPFVGEPFAGAWQRNISWSVDTVLAHHAVYACVTRIAQDVGKLRPKLVEEDEEAGIWTEVRNPAFSGVLAQPNRFQNHIQFKEWWITSKLIHGNAYVLLDRDNRGTVRAMYLLDPTRVTVLVAPDGAVFYELRADNLSGLEQDRVAVPASEIIHDRMNCLFHPLVGTSPIYACGQAASMGLEIEKNSATFFGNGSNPSGILSSPTAITPKQSEDLSTIWNSKFGGDGSGGVAVLGNGMKFEQMRMSAVDSQLIEQLQWTSETVCSTFHVPPWKIGIGSQPAYTKPEISNQAYYSDCLQTHIEAMELGLDQGLGFRAGKVGEAGNLRTLGVELDLDGLLRMDPAGQVATMKEAVGGSLLSINDARRRLSERPVDGGDTIWMQQQNYSLEALQKRDENDPFAKAQPATPALPGPDAVKALPAPAEEPTEEERAFSLKRRSARRARTLRIRTLAA